MTGVGNARLIEVRTDREAETSSYVQRAGLLCRPISSLVRWMVADDAAENAWAQKISGVMTSFSEPCPDTLGTPAAHLAERARTSTRQALTWAKTVTNREIQGVTGPDRVRFAGLGEARLLGITVPAEKREAALGYLQHAVAGKRLAVTVATAQDPERRPLVVVTLPDGTSVNARLIRQGLAQPWRTAGPWQQWATGSAGS